METTAEVKTKYNLKLAINGEVFEAEGDSVLECFGALPVLKNIKTVGIFTLKSENKETEMRLPIPQVKRLFVNKTAKEIFTKRILTLLK